MPSAHAIAAILIMLCIALIVWALCELADDWKKGQDNDYE